jgi:hypothetical protein
MGLDPSRRRCVGAFLHRGHESRAVGQRLVLVIQHYRHPSATTRDREQGAGTCVRSSSFNRTSTMLGHGERPLCGGGAAAGDQQHSRHDQGRASDTQRVKRHDAAEDAGGLQHQSQQ